MRARIQKVTRASLRKELSALRQFFAWLVEHGVQGLPVVPPLPKAGHPGVRHKHARKRQPTILQPDEIASLLMAMPERSRRTGSFVRPLFEVFWETGLRPAATVLRLEIGVHYMKGAAELFISREIDKMHYERQVPLTAEARAALDRAVGNRTSGLVFVDVEEDSLRESVEAACKAAGISKKVSPYDFRHSRASFWANSGAPLAGVAFLLGHKHISTTALYVRTNATAAGAVLDLVAAQRKASRAEASKRRRA